VTLRHIGGNDLERRDCPREEKGRQTPNTMQLDQAAQEDGRIFKRLRSKKCWEKRGNSTNSFRRGTVWPKSVLDCHCSNNVRTRQDHLVWRQTTEHSSGGNSYEKQTNWRVQNGSMPHLITIAGEVNLKNLLITGQKHRIRELETFQNDCQNYTATLAGASNNGHPLAARRQILYNVNRTRKP